MSELKPCPRCGTENTDNWPLYTGETTQDGGCQECWEEECSRLWWKMVSEMPELA